MRDVSPPRVTFPRLRRLAGVLLLALLTLTLGIGCSGPKAELFGGYNKDAQGLRGHWSRGDLTAASAEVNKRAAKSDGRDSILWRLEKGAVLRAAGDYEASNEAFADALDRIEARDEQSKTRMSQEAKAVMTNLAQMDYEAGWCDRVMLHTYRALNFMALGESDMVRTELMAAYFEQQEAVQRNAKRIEKALAEAEGKGDTEEEKSKSKVDVDRARQDPQLAAALQQSYGHLDDHTAYSNYVNPYCEMLQGLYFMAAAVDGSDVERSRTAWSRIMSMCRDNEYALLDALMVERHASGEPLPDLTYVIFETGCAPTRESIRIDLPIFAISSGVTYVGAAFPNLVKKDDCHGNLAVYAGGSEYPTSLLCDMDAAIGQEFKNELPVTITKTLIGTASKTGAQSVGSKGDGRDPAGEPGVENRHDTLHGSDEPGGSADLVDAAQAGAILPLRDAGGRTGDAATARRCSEAG